MLNFLGIHDPMDKSDFYRQMLDSINEGAYFVSPDRTIKFWNKAAERITGFSAEEVIDRHCYENFQRHVDEEGNMLCFGGCPLQVSMETKEGTQAKLYLHHKNGHRLPVNVRCNPIIEHGKVLGAIEVFNDDSTNEAIKEENLKLVKLAMVDPLTGVYNRRCIGDHINVKLSELQRYGNEFGLLFADIDHFKDVNDKYGHDIGDEVLRVTANTLKYNVRASDTVGRWGGEEFVIVVTGSDETDFITIADKLRGLVASSGYRLDKNFISPTISVGATLATRHDTIDSLVSRADLLMYESKDSGRDKITFDFKEAA